MFQHQLKHTVGILLSGFVVAVVGYTHQGSALAQPAGEKAKAKNEDSLGYTAHFQRELRPCVFGAIAYYHERVEAVERQLDELDRAGRRAKFKLIQGGKR